MMQMHAGPSLATHIPILPQPQRLWAANASRRSRGVQAKAMIDVLRSCNAQDLLLARTTAGNEEFVEVITACNSADAPTEASIVVGWKGQLLKLQRQSETEYLDVQNVGYYPEATGILCQRIPQLQQHLKACQESAGQLTWRVADLEMVSSLERLTESVTKDPSLWCDGTKPGAPSNSPLAAATMTAGMLLALMGGRRGIATLQLWNGWDKTRGQPVYDPLALHVLDKVLSLPGVSCLPSVAPGGVGITAIVYVDREPWCAWAKHLASFGMQANIVAGSPYYKLLIGLILGYKEENVRGYVAATSGPGALTPALVKDVESEMRKLSKVKPKLPWNVSSRGKKAGTTGKVAVGFGSGKGK